MPPPAVVHTNVLIHATPDEQATEVVVRQAPAPAPTLVGETECSRIEKASSHAVHLPQSVIFQHEPARANRRVSRVVARAFRTAAEVRIDFLRKLLELF